MEPQFSLDQARALLPRLRAQADRIVGLRADLADAQAAVADGREPPGGIPAVKSVEAHLQEAVDWFAANGIQLKGIAPIIADLPGELDGDPVLLCWLEGEETLDWYHPPHTGFMGRRRLAG